MSSHIKLKYLGKFYGGSGFPESEQGILEEKYPFYKVRDLSKNDTLRETNNYISEETANSLNATILPPNTIVFAKVGAALLLRRFCFLSQDSCVDNNMMGFISNSKQIDNRYAKFCFSLLPFSEIVNPGAVPSINEGQIKNLSIYTPPIADQKKIASYLDQKTAEIDRLITAKKRLLSLLDEKKQALIAHAVTRGLDPDVGLEDSGVPWLGLIPAHWRTERTKWILPEIDERSETGEEELLSVSHLTGVTLRSEKNVNMFMSESLEGYKKCDAGDLVINTLWAWMGAMGVSRVNGVVSPAYNVYRPTEAIMPDYLDLLVRMPNFVSEITRYSKGVWSSRLRLYPEGLYEAYIPVPPLEEQKRIISELKIQLEHFAKLYDATEKTISLLQERRAALISAAVTGKIDQEVLDAG